MEGQGSVRRRRRPVRLIERRFTPVRRYTAVGRNCW
jgi:hypothetical protein